MSRLASGGQIDRSRDLDVLFDGRQLVAHPGDTLASALLANGIRLVGRSFKYHRPRGILAAGSEEPNALVTIGHHAARIPNVRATMQEAHDGLVAFSQNRWPTLGLDLMAVNDLASPFLGAGFWTWGIFGAFLYALRLVTAAEGRPAWQVIGQPPAPELGEAEPEVERSARRLALSTAAAAAVIFVAGYALARASEALAEQTGLGSSLFGAVFVAIATSLPEISTVLAAIRLGRHVMATSDILGTNLFDIALIFLVDLIYAGDPVLNEVGAFSQVAAMLGITVTGVFVVGMIERRDPAIRGIGLDSLIVGAAYLGGLGLLFHLR